MKRIFTFILAAISIQSFAQNLTGPTGNTLSDAEKQSLIQSKSYFKQHAYNKTNATDGGWYNYLDALESSGLGTTTTYYWNMFDDSTVQTLRKNSTTGVVSGDYVGNHMFGMVTDPRGDCFNGAPFQSERFTKYTMDSIAVAYGYRRHNPDANIVDTLVIQVYAQAAAKYYSLVSNKVVLVTLDYDYLTNLGKTPYKTIKVPLTTADTAAGSKIAFAVLNPPLSIPAGGQGMVSYKYKSGQTYAFGDTMNADFDPTLYPVKNKLNECRMFMATETSGYDQSTTADPTYNRVYNNGLIVFTDLRYNTAAAGSWAGTFISGNAYNTHYVPDVNMKITSTNVGINSAAKQYLADVQVYPNPSNGASTVTVEYKLTKSANVSIEIVNILGKKISNVNVGKTDIGTQSQAINVSELANGIYFANIYVDGAVQTVKFTVAK